VLGADLAGSGNERRRTSDPGDPRPAASGQRQALDRSAQELIRVARATQRVTKGALARRRHAFTHRFRRLAGRALKLASARSRDRDDQVETVEERSRELVPVRGQPRRRA
jgi:hypothetical protein